MSRFQKGLLIVGGLGLAAFIIYQMASGPPPPIEIRGDDRARPVSSAIAAFDPDEIVSVLSRDAIEAIDEPKLVPAGQADLVDDELVVGVEIEGEARAYPIRVLSAHEIVNDDIAGQPFAVTW